MSYENAANATAIELVQCAESHCRAFMVSSAYEMTRDINKKLSPELAAVIHPLIELYAFDTCFKSMGDLLRVSGMNLSYYLTVKLFFLILMICTHSPKYTVHKHQGIGYSATATEA